jgi:hypothetical protein
MSFAEQFLAGQKFAQGLIETYRDARQRRELDEISKAQPVNADFLSDDASAKVQAAAADPTQQIGYDTGAKAYMATPKLGENEMGPAQPKQIATAVPMTELLGKRTPGTMTPEQVSSAKFKAMADVVSKYDPIQGMRLQREVKQGERDDKRWERENATATEAENDKAFAEKLDAQVGDWFKGRLKNPDGTERAPTVDDHLAASQYRAAQLMGAGKIDQAGQVLKDYAAQSLVKIQLQGAQRKEALGRTAAALASGDLDAVKEFYNEFVPDGARVTDVKRGAGGELVIQRESLDGRALPVYTMKDTGQLLSVLNSFNDPMALYSWSQNEFKNNIDARKTAVAERNADIAERRLGALEARANGGGGSGSGGASGAGAAGWKERREVLGDFGKLLPSADTAATPQEAEKIQASNTQALAKADTLFSTNAQFGNVLTAPQLRAAMVQAEVSPKSIRTQVDTESGMAFKYVVVNGAKVIVDVSTAAAQKQEAPASKQDAATGGKTDTVNPSPKPAPAPYVPPADSPAGKAKAAREAAQKAAQQQQMQKIAAVTKAASDALASKDPSAAQAVQDMPGFDSLPTAQKAEIRRIVFGR